MDISAPWTFQFARFCLRDPLTLRQIDGSPRQIMLI